MHTACSIYRSIFGLYISLILAITDMLNNFSLVMAIQGNLNSSLSWGGPYIPLIFSIKQFLVRNAWHKGNSKMLITSMLWFFKNNVGQIRGEDEDHKKLKCWAASKTMVIDSNLKRGNWRGEWTTGHRRQKKIETSTLSITQGSSVKTPGGFTGAYRRP